MSSARKNSRAAKRKQLAQTNAKTVPPATGRDDELDRFLTELRVSRYGDRLPQGCTPAEKLAYLEALARRHGVKPIDDPVTMVADFWPARETADELVNAVRALRRQGK